MRRAELKANTPLPKLVRVTALEIHPWDDELPSLAGLRDLRPADRRSYGRRLRQIVAP
jgi:hypothetical protein